MSNEWETSESGTILLKAARLLALSIHRLSATTSRIFLAGLSSLRRSSPSIGRLVILNVGDKRQKEREREGRGLSRRVGTGIGWDGVTRDEAVRVRDGRTGAVRRRYRRDDRCFRTNY